MTLRNIQIVNVALTTANDEYSITIPSGAIDVQVQLADATHSVQVYQVSVGNSGTPANSWTICAGQTFKLGTTLQQQQELYLMPATSSTVAQVSYYLDQ